MTRLSVIMPVLNGARHIGEAIASVLPQLATDDELLVVDNGSTDGTPQLVAATGDRRLRLLHAATRGPAAARNVGLAAMTGELVSFLDHDDLWPPARLAGLLETLGAHPEADAVVGRIRVQFDAGPEERYCRMDGLVSDKVVLGPFVFRAAVLRRIGSFDEALMQGEDLDFLLRVRAAGARTVQWPGDALIYRRHETNMTRDIDEGQRGNFRALAQHAARRRGQS